MLNPLLEKSLRVLPVGATGSSSSSSRTVDTSLLACQRATGTQPLVQQVDVLGFALDIPIRVAVCSGTRRPPLEDFQEVAGAVDDDAEALPHEGVGERPLEPVCMFCHLFKCDVGIEKTGSDNIVTLYGIFPQ
jgi:hypothetical protein